MCFAAVAVVPFLPSFFGLGPEGAEDVPGWDPGVPGVSFGAWAGWVTFCPVPVVISPGVLLTSRLPAQFAGFFGSGCTNSLALIASFATSHLHRMIVLCGIDDVTRASSLPPAAGPREPVGSV